MLYIFYPSVAVFLLSFLWAILALRREKCASKSVESFRVKLWLGSALFLGGFGALFFDTGIELEMRFLLVAILFGVFALFLTLQNEMPKKSILDYRESIIFSEVLNTVPIPMFYKSLDGIYIECNKAFLEFIGKSHGEIVGKHTCDVFLGQNGLDIVEAEARLKHRGQIETHESHFVNGNNERFMKIYKTLVFDHENNASGVLGFFVDVGDYQASQQELIERQEQLEFFSEQLEKQMEYEVSGRLNSERRYKQLFDSGRDGIFVAMINEDSGSVNIAEANFSAHSILGYEVGTLSGLDFISLIESEERENVQNLLKALPLRAGMLTESKFAMSDGHEIPIELAVQSFLLEGKKTLYISARDITERLKMAEEKRIQENLLVQQSKMASMGEMIGAIAHQWKQPLNAIYLMCQGLKESFAYNELDEEEMDRYVSMTMKQVDFMSRTISDFRNFFMPSKEKKPFALKEALMEINEILAPQFAKNDVRVRITQDGDGSIVAYGYPNEFKQVALNIMNNARDAIEDRISKGAKISGEVEVSVFCDDTFAGVRIKDNGGGIPEELLKTIFQPYFSTKGEKGTGIGLSIAKMIIEKNMNGRITAYNDDDGAIFEIRLPLDSRR
ncbi:MAG: PAS domain-containing sensor histidine kinase [Wolinella sp.]